MIWDDLYELGPIEKVYNLYGPSEATTYATYVLVPRHSDSPVTIGRPVSGTEVYILNESGEGVPLGAAGELYIGGEGVARGYYHRERLTEEKFVEKQLPLVGRKRLYRTGDLVRYRVDGQLEFLGRIDSQVKLRGFRIELGEIETLLRAAGGVNDAVVSKEEADGQEVLVAYRVLAPGAVGREVVAGLRCAVKGQLPSYMAPASYKIIDAIPLTPNGKIDRKCLADAMGTLVEHAAMQEHLPPRKELETIITTIWCDLLQRENVGVSEDFFSAGGHSLLALRAAEMIKERLDPTFSVSDMFEFPTIQSIAERIGGESESLSCITTISADGENTPLVMIHPWSGLVSPYFGLASYIQDRPLYGLSSPAMQGETAAWGTLEEMVSEYVILLEPVLPSGPIILGGWSFGGVVAYEMARRLSELDMGVENLLLVDEFNVRHFRRSPDYEHLRDIVTRYETTGDDFDVMNRRHVELMLAYDPKTYWGKVSLLKAAVTLGEERVWHKDPLNGWGGVIAGELTAVMLPGYHDDLFSADSLSETAKAIAHALV